jgi:hypothetical protein
MRDVAVMGSSTSVIAIIRIIFEVQRSVGDKIDVRHGLPKTEKESHLKI